MYEDNGYDDNYFIYSTDEKITVEIDVTFLIAPIIKESLHIHD